ncbi:hypothetical protein [Jidongwangia harbinensis]|uniref:hypothetical protein n=1 Tax=Jidongwangia harbinensis TaxID=2878561 RepID=UPI001CD973F7|nr:hypothetical protein [Jidongwangia harbinensis]MCA2215648.1 hypothetical protein [Jidongwangia harbinensis]
MPAQSFAAAVDRLLHQVGHWEGPRWSAVPGAADRSRAELVHDLVQRLADRTADVEGRARRPVPRAGALVLADQLRVMRDDLVAVDAPDDVLKHATTDVEAVHRAL